MNIQKFGMRFIRFHEDDGGSLTAELDNEGARNRLYDYIHDEFTTAYERIRELEAKIYGWEKFYKETVAQLTTDIVNRDKSIAELESAYKYTYTLLEGAAQGRNKAEAQFATANERIGDLEATIEHAEADVALVYCHITDGQLSKLNTDPKALIALVDDLENERIATLTDDRDTARAALRPFADEWCELLEASPDIKDADTIGGIPADYFRDAAALLGDDKEDGDEKETG